MHRSHQEQWIHCQPARNLHDHVPGLGLSPMRFSNVAPVVKKKATASAARAAIHGPQQHMKRYTSNKSDKRVNPHSEGRRNMCGGACHTMEHHNSEAASSRFGNLCGPLRRGATTLSKPVGPHNSCKRSRSGGSWSPGSVSPHIKTSSFPHVRVEFQFQFEPVDRTRSNRMRSDAIILPPPRFLLFIWVG